MLMLKYLKKSFKYEISSTITTRDERANEVYLMKMISRKKFGKPIYRGHGKKNPVQV